MSVAGVAMKIQASADGWVSGVAPAAGDALAMHRRQSAVLAPVRLAAGPVLLAEIPCDGDPAEAAGVVEAALEEGLRCIAAGSEPSGVEGDPEAAAARLMAALEDIGVACERNGIQFQLRIATGAFPQKIAAAPRGSIILLHGDLAKWKEIAPVSEEALVHFPLSLNRRLRLARGSLGEDRVGVEVALPASILRPRLLEIALAVGARLSRRECAALLDPKIARDYVEFHISKEQI